jgi:hypothetical protein
MNVCHELVTYANEIEFPATEVVVKQKTYAGTVALVERGAQQCPSTRLSWCR